MKKQWITFDLDNTIMQNPFKEYVFPEIERRIHEKLKDYDLNVINLIFKEHRRRVKDNLTLASYDWDEIVSKVISELQLSLEIDIEDIVIQHSVEPKIYLLENELVENLSNIKEKGFSIGVVTNGFYKYQMPVLKALGLVEIFDAIITSDHAGYAKPNVKIMSKFKDDKLVAHVGDRIDHDVVVANELGIESVYINRDLNQNILNENINQRASTDEFLSSCEEKWSKEGNKSTFDPEIGLPNIVIQSIKEFSANINHLLKV